ncbi:ABC transporter substrate-binding protein [Paenibacillus sp. S150]|uniref:ABC transporter substrate-binding protein n=1 Tax=Paenibacillus sp. S150 TaxID=2749826 RepID=UPI001C5A48EF|nr:extracellular solute-binding protein [Paenibacillus sp. S150]MBW4081003.1 extracellular solute-binding protein [Paenibacillus sp. S150]
MNRKALSFLTALLLTAAPALSGCSGAANEEFSEATAPTSAAVSEPVTLEFWGRWEEANPQIAETIAEFQAEHPGIKVNYSTIPFAQYVAQLQTAISGGDLPDIFGSHPSLPTYQLSQLDIIHPIDDLITDEVQSEFFEGTWSEGETTLDGNVYSIPLFNPKRAAMELFYNKSVLTKAGLTEADIPKTWDELVTFSRKVKEGTNGEAYGVVMGIKASSLAASIVQQMATAIKPEVVPSTSIPINYKTGLYEINSPSIVETLEYFKLLYDQELLHPNSLVMNMTEGAALMISGQAALLFDGAYEATKLPADQLDNFGVAPLPTKDGKKQYFAYNGGAATAALFVAKTTKHYEETKLFLQYLMDHLYPKLVRDGVEYSPVTAQNEETEVTHLIAKKGLALQNETVILVPRPYVKNSATIDVAKETSGKLPKTTLLNVIEGYLSGQIQDISAELTAINEEANKVRDSAIKKLAAEGVAVSLEDYQFSDWVPLQPYTGQ